MRAPEIQRRRNVLRNTGGIVMLAGLILLIFSTHYLAGLVASIVGFAITYANRADEVLTASDADHQSMQQGERMRRYPLVIGAVCLGVAIAAGWRVYETGHLLPTDWIALGVFLMLVTLVIAMAKKAARRTLKGEIRGGQSDDR